MESSNETSSFLNDLDRIANSRDRGAKHLSKLAETLLKAELAGHEGSGQLGLEPIIEDIKLASQNLKQGVFRLLVLGDIKRGKSTLLNALMGESLLPSDVNPCTALLTVLRYGTDKKVTVYFKADKRPEQLDFETFKQKYTIDPDEAKRLEQENQQAFPNVSHAVVEYPLALLEKGIEIVDSPGLNDTEARNELSLSYIKNCHAILFVFRAGQPVTLQERRYLENYIKGRGLTVFFLINAWDEIQAGLIDPDDPEELQEAIAKLRQVFRANLADYCKVNGQDIYQERVFELSSIQALRRRIKNPNDSLEGTGFPPFIKALNSFLTQERAVAEMRQVKILARKACDRIHEAVERRISLVERDVTDLKQRISLIEPEFNQLSQICDRFQKEIIAMRDRKADALAHSFKDYILNLDKTFDSDFMRYQPTIGLLEFLQAGKREEFATAFQKAFEQYLNDKISAWELTAEREMSDAFAELASRATKYGEDYAQITDSMTEKLIGQKSYTQIADQVEDDSPYWGNWAVGFLSLAFGNVAGVALAGAGFHWTSILANFIASLAVQSFLVAFTGFATGPVGIILVGLGVGTFQAEQARQEMLKVIKKEFVQYLPQLAQEQQQSIKEVVRKCFDSYESEVTKRINNDISARKSELDNLVKQKETKEVNYETELERLKSLDTEVLIETQGIESVYDELLAIPV